MIILGSKCEGANTIHAIAGPESELFMAVHGAVAVDITPIVRAMGTEVPLSLLLTRCRSEAELTQELTRRGIPHTAVGQSCGTPEAKAGDPGDSGPDLQSLIRQLPDRQRKD